MRIVVTGGRDYTNFADVCEVLHFIRRGSNDEETVLINGLANGADSLCRLWAIQNNVEPMDFPAKWDDLDAEGAVIRTRRDGSKYNMAAGFIRNQAMIDVGKPSILVAFPGGRGTLDMVNRCRKAMLPIFTIPR